MSETDIDVDFNQVTNNFIKEEPHLMDLSHHDNPIQTDSRPHEDVDCDEQFVSQAGDNTLSSLNVDNIKYENIEEYSFLSSYDDQDLKPNASNGFFCLLKSEMCVNKELQCDVKKEENSSFQDVYVTSLGFNDEIFEMCDSQQNVETKFDASAKCDYYQKNQDTNFGFISDIRVLEKKKVENADSNKADWHLLENLKCTTATDLGNLVCQCKKTNNEIKLEIISTLNQSSYLPNDTDWNKSSTTDDLQAEDNDQNTCTKVEESRCDCHKLSIKDNLSNNEDILIEEKQGSLSNSHVFGSNMDLFSESASSVHTPFSQPHIEKSCRKSNQLARQNNSQSQLTKLEIEHTGLIQHEITQKSLKPFKCSECSKGFIRKRYLTRHKHLHNGLKPFNCSECSKGFTRKTDLMRHENLHYGLRPFRCLKCSKGFTQKQQLTDHENIHKGMKPFKCSECSKCFSRKNNLMAHENIHRGVKPFKCLECSQCFTQKQTLTAHENTHKGIKPFKCLKCSKCFNQKAQLKQHEKIHQSLKPFKCSECSKYFTHKSSLTQHEKIHQGLKPFECSECSKCFNQKHNLIRHENDHKGLKPFKCSECSKCFTRKIDLARHENIHKGLKPFKCSECSKCFTQKRHLKNHEKNHQIQSPLNVMKDKQKYIYGGDMPFNDLSYATKIHVRIESPTLPTSSSCSPLHLNFSFNQK